MDDVTPKQDQAVWLQQSLYIAVVFHGREVDPVVQNTLRCGTSASKTSMAKHMENIMDGIRGGPPIACPGECVYVHMYHNTAASSLAASSRLAYAVAAYQAGNFFKVK